MKKRLATLLAAAMTVSALTVSMATGSGFVLGSGASSSGSSGGATYHYMAHIPGSSQAYESFNDANGVDVWVGGGRATFTNGATANGKEATLALFVKENDGKFYNITNARTTLWGSFTAKGSKTTSSYKLASTVDKDGPKVSKGKVTAGKKEGTFYASAVVGVDKKAESAGTWAGDVLVNVKQAATTIQFHDTKATSSGAPATDSTVLKAVSVPVGKSVTVYPIGLAKSGKDLDAANKDNTYSIVVDSKSIDFVTINGNTELNNLSTSDLASGIAVGGKALKDNKVTKASIEIINNESGKKSKLTVNVDNSVVAVKSSGGAITFEKGKTDTKSADLADYATVALTGVATTDKPVAVVVDKSKTVDMAKDLFDKGKPKIASGLKTSDKVTAAFKNGKFEVKVDKSVNKDAEYVAIFVFNANKLDGSTYTGVVQIPVKVNGGSNSSGSSGA